ncbi:unnamed protein product [Rhizophagus irregularis]|uniref:Anaphase-promoting complex subunit 5 domain-containing protein n=1 Tax=Rhizophagus irregularis TaxID=588596 RepID=A0A916A0L0_9GLOM|nr:unnamed protein product [Rhizophagus irregularis]CAB5396286.1 unnamed protein product [Rhizophagus irregularis]
MARENNDQECLRFALSWLYRLKSSDQTIGTPLGELGKSQRQIQQGSPPTEVFESLLRSSVLNMNCPFKTMRFQGHLLNASAAIP